MASDGSKFKYLIVRPEKGGMMELWRYMLWGDIVSGMAFLESSEEGLKGGEAADNRWVILVSIVVRKILMFAAKPMEYTGYLIEFFLNLLSENGDLFGLLYNLLNGKVVTPRRGSETYISSIGHIDGRIDLYKSNQDMVEQIKVNINAESGNRAMMDLSIMASKLSYENAKVVQNVVFHHWKMHFVEFYDCWNDFQKECSTQVFILCDKPKDANLILISFRGTEPFDADDWCTDFDYSWYEIPKLGKFHMGFLEAMGLGNREDTSTFQFHLQMGNQFSSSDIDSDDDKFIPPDMVKKTAYYAVRRRLKILLREHDNAKFVVTGHSLGGALAILFPTVLVLHDQMEIMQRLAGVYTFGQPRIGNWQLGKFMEAHIEFPVPKYFRVVYCNDIVPRLPYDDKTFLYKHFGVCLYFDSCYFEQKMDEEPNPNFFGWKYGMLAYLNATWELMRALIMGYKFGPDYKEGWFSIFVRLLGLALPGISAHCPTDYVNSIRLGRFRTLQMFSLSEVSPTDPK